jgi:hypothetical protein
MIEVYQYFTDNPYDDTVLFVEWPMVYDRKVNRYPYRARVTNIRTLCNNVSRQLKIPAERWLWVQRDNQLWVRYLPLDIDMVWLSPSMKAFVIGEQTRRARAKEMADIRKLNPNTPKNFLGEYKPIKVQKRQDQ